MTLKAATRQFPLAYPAIRSLVAGMVSPTEVDQNLAALLNLTEKVSPK